MNQKPRNELSISVVLLTLIFAGSVYQYLDKKEVTWITASFQWVESQSKSLIDNTDAVSRSLVTGTPAESDSPAATYDLFGKVVRIADGDTLTILDADRRQTKIRLAGIDTPEKGQPFGGNAKRALSSLVWGKSVRIEVKDIDRYGRTVCVVHVGGKNINIEMVRSGHAWWYQRYAKGNRQLANAEKEARSDGLGLWQDSSPIPPWEWRRGKRS